MDMKKEIKLSDLFRRGGKKDAVAAPEVDAPVKEPKASRFKRRKDVDGEAPEQVPKPPKEPRRGRSSKGAAPVPQVPLMRAFNLLPKQDERGADGRSPTTPQLVLAVAGLVLLALLASIFLISNARVADKETTVDELKTKLAELNVASQSPVPQGPDAVLVQERDARTGALSTALGSRVAWDRLMRNISLVLPDDVWLGGLDAHAATLADPAAGPVDPNAPTSESTFEITGYTRRQESVAQLLSRLAVLPEIATVKLGSATATKIGDEAVIQFIISATLKPVGATVAP